MESFYDREAGVAWGPVTKQELLDDLLIYKPSKSKIRHRNTLNGDPSFAKKMEERFTDLTTNSTIRQPIGVDEDAVVISSDEEEDSLDDEPLVDEISREISNLDLCQSDLKNRLPTPANIDEDTFDESLKEDMEKLEEFESLSYTHSESNNSVLEESEVLQENIQGLSVQDINDKSNVEISCSCDTSSGELAGKEQEVFNDTLSEMERLLNEGLNYTMGTDKTCSQVFPDDRQSNNCANEETCHQYLLDVPKIKLQSTVESPPMTPSISKNYKGVNVANKSSVKKKTKIPIAPTFALNKPTPKAVLTPTNLKYTLPKPSPAHVNPKRRFKDIESPISLYIKNSGVAPLFKKITPSKQLNSDNGKSVRKQQERSNDKENSLVFPEVIYKPAKKTIVKECSDFKLPKNIESLIPQKPNVIRHERHVGGGSKLNQSFISKKLCEPDITIDSSTSLDSTGDISVHCAKRVFITKNSFK